MWQKLHKGTNKLLNRRYNILTTLKTSSQKKVTIPIMDSLKITLHKKGQTSKIFCRKLQELQTNKKKQRRRMRKSNWWGLTCGGSKSTKRTIEPSWSETTKTSNSWKKRKKI